MLVNGRTMSGPPFEYCSSIRVCLVGILANSNSCISKSYSSHTRFLHTQKCAAIIANHTANHTTTNIRILIIIAIQI